MKIGRIALASAVAMVAAVASVSSANAQQLKRINIGTNPAGSSYFLLASGFAKLFQEKLDIRSTAQPHAGSSVYLPLMDTGEIVLGLNNSLDSGMAIAGKAPYSAPLKNVRIIARIWVLPYAYITKDSSGIRSMDDLRGKRVAVKVKTNVSLEQANETMLSTAGFKSEAVDAVDSGGVVEGINMVVEDRAVAATVSLTMPALRQAHATIPGGIRVVPLGEKGTSEFLDAGMPGLYAMTIKPSPTLPFIKEDTLISAFDTYLNAGSTVTDEDAYVLVKTLHTNWADLQKDYPPLRGLQANELAPAANTAPYHPGAIKYFKEIGIWTAENEARQASVMAIIGN
ncbi:MAG: TAXI family TRAP transporter solute-binding subunit [Rhodospirillaceae bacterium]